VTTIANAYQFSLLHPEMNFHTYTVVSIPECNREKISISSLHLARLSQKTARVNHIMVHV